MTDGPNLTPTALVTQSRKAPWSALTVAGKRVTEFSIIKRNFVRNPGAMAGLFSMAALVLIAGLADLVAPYDPLEQTRAFLQPPSWEHPFGTDPLGRDILSRVIHGARTSLSVGVGAVFVAMFIGFVVGVTGGYFGKRIDAFVVMVVDTFMSFPGILLAMVIVSMFGNTLPVVMLAVGLGEFTLFARLIRSVVYAEKERDYILASRSLGAGPLFIILSHILPNILGPLIVLITVSIGNAILAAAALGFLGLGAQPPLPEWGTLVNSGREYIQIAPWLVWFPGLAIMVTVLSANLLGDGLRDALDPKLRR
jgi:ABC-type dipeptide/oligopeptide/nickel transport system permease subunit